MASLQLQKVREFLSCAVCYDTFTDPCTLNCQHTFCRKCITKYLNTRPDVVRSKAIPCPSCRQKTKVPSPAKPVGEWAWQIKPSIIILGLLDTSPTYDDVERCCLVCEHLGEITPATAWCQECEMTLCERCTRAHRLNVGSRDHEVCKLSDNLQMTKRRKLMCKEHEKNMVEFHCKDCDKPACQSCCVLYHRTCLCLVTIESMKEEMRSELKKAGASLSEQLEQTTQDANNIKCNIKAVSQKKLSIKSEIQLVSQTVVDRIREQEKKLMDKLDQASRTQLSQLRADMKTNSIQGQTYKQHFEFIDQAVNSESVFGMYEMFQMLKSGELIVESVKNSKLVRRIDDITFIQDTERRTDILEQLELGEITVQHQTETGTEIETLCNTETDLMSAPVMCNEIDTKTADNNNNNPDVIDIVVLEANGKQVLVVTDWDDDGLKSFFTTNSQLQCSKISLGKRPSGLTQLDNKVMVTVLGCRQIITVDVTPELVYSSSITTQKLYMSLAAISSSSLAVGCFRPTPCVDILNMTGHVIMSISTHNNEELFKKPVYLCMNQGNIVVSDWDMKCITCLNATGEVLWRYSPSGSKALKRAYGITATKRGEILLADRESDKVILLTENGEFCRDVLIGGDGISKPRGVFFDDKRGCLYVSEENTASVREFIFGIKV